MSASLRRNLAVRHPDVQGVVMANPLHEQFVDAVRALVVSAMRGEVTDDDLAAGLARVESGRSQLSNWWARGSEWVGGVEKMDELERWVQQVEIDTALLRFVQDHQLGEPAWLPVLMRSDEWRVGVRVDERYYAVIDVDPLGGDDGVHRSAIQTDAYRRLFNHGEAAAVRGELARATRFVEVRASGNRWACVEDATPLDWTELTGRDQPGAKWASSAGPGMGAHA